MKLSFATTILSYTCMFASGQNLRSISRELVVKDKGCRSKQPDGLIFSKADDAVVNYFSGFNCPRPKSTEPGYYCRTRDSDNSISFNEDVMTVDTNKWVAGGFRMGCMKKDFSTGWQCAAACGIGPNLPTLSDVS